MSYISGEDRNQSILFPESLEGYITPDNPVRIIDEYVTHLDLQALKFTHTSLQEKGRPPYHPGDMLRLYLYGYLHHIRSSRRLETEAGRNVELMWLIRKLSPDFKTIADFRRDNKKALVSVFRDFTHLCSNWQLFGKELIAIDGSKFRASNSKRNNYSRKKLARHIRYIEEKITGYLTELDETDQAESVDRKPDAAEVQKRINQLKERKARYQSYQDKLKETNKNELSTTDPDARLMANNNNTVEVSYNVQACVDARHKLIADFKVINKPNDLGQLAPMALRTRKILQKKNFTVLADKGYYHAPNLAYCSRKGITTYVSRQLYANGTGDKEFYPDKFTYDQDHDCYLCPAGQKLYYYRTRKKDGKIIGKTYRNVKACRDCPVKARCTRAAAGRTIFRHQNQDFLDDIDRQTRDNLATYQLRQMIVEHPFGTIKRAWGASYFLTRRKASVSAEIALSFLCYNIKRVINILGTEEILRRLRENKQAVPVI
jgi:transposase/Zn-finger protein